METRYEAEFNWASCECAKVRGRYVVLITAPTSTSRLGTAPVSPQSLNFLPRQLGFGRLSPSGLLPDDASTGRVVVTTAGIVVTLPEGNVGAFHAPEGDVSKLGNATDVVLLAGGPHSGRSALDRIKKAASERLAIGIKAEVLDLRPMTERPAAVGVFTARSGVRIEWPKPKTRIYVDQTFLVSLDKCLSNDGLPPGNGEALWHHLRNAMAWLAGCDPIPGFGFAECAAGEDGVKKAKALQAAWESFRTHALVPADRDALKDAYESYVPSPDDDLSDLGDDQVPPLVALNYLGVLHAYRLWKAHPKYIPHERITAWFDWLDALNNESAGISAYPRAVISTLLLSDRDLPEGQDSRNAPARLAERLLKFKPRSSRPELLGAAWDLAHLGHRDILQTDLIPSAGVGPLIFLTADKPLQILSLTTDFLGTLETSGGPIGTVGYATPYSSKLSSQQVEVIKSKEQQINRDQHLRASRRTDNITKLYTLIDELERELNLA